MIVNPDALADIRNRYLDKRLVLTSGTFDLFHANHLRYLEKAREYGDVMVVMISSDTRVRSSKGESRPIYPELDRATIINGLKVVDYVFIEPGKNKYGEFNQIYLDVFTDLAPDIYVTANEAWGTIEEMMGSTELVLLPRTTGGYYSSTSAIIEHITKL